MPVAGEPPEEAAEKDPGASVDSVVPEAPEDKSAEASRETSGEASEHAGEENPGEALADASDDAGDGVSDDASEDVGEYKPKVEKGLVVGVIALGVALVVIIVAIISAAVGYSGEPAPATASSPSESAASASSASAASASSASASSGSSASASPASSASASASASAHQNSRYLDENDNLTLSALAELSGTELQDLLAQSRFQWDQAISSWSLGGSALFSVQDADGPLDRQHIDSLPAGADGQPVLMNLTAAGYATPSKAFAGLVSDLAIDDIFGDDEAFFAIVRSSSGAQFLVAITPIGDNAQSVLVFTDATVANGLFAQLVGMDVGTTLDSAWKSLTGGYHIGEYNVA